MDKDRKVLILTYCRNLVMCISASWRGSMDLRLKKPFAARVISKLIFKAAAIG